MLAERFKAIVKNPIGYLDLTSKVDPSKFAYQAFDFDTF
jgi:hypothetical protein